MATLQTNVIKGDRFNPYALEKGDYGEILVKKFFEDKGYIIYQSGTMAPHPVDMIVCRKGTIAFACEVKAKPACSKYPETGIDYYQYENYKQFSDSMNIPVFLAFVDEERGEIYGNYLHELDKPTVYKDMKYPKTIGHKGGGNLTRYFPLCNMLRLRYLTFNEANFLKKLSQKHIKGAA